MPHPLRPPLSTGSTNPEEIKSRMTFENVLVANPSLLASKYGKENADKYF
jgi:hypothetical protein